MVPSTILSDENDRQWQRHMRAAHYPFVLDVEIIAFFTVACLHVCLIECLSMSNYPSPKQLKYLETDIDDRYKDTSEKLYYAWRRQELSRNPGDVQLGPYLTVANSKTVAEDSVQVTPKSAICAIL